MLNKFTRANSTTNRARAPLQAAGVLLVLLALAGCSKGSHKPGQALASVNGEEVTVLQLNEELQRANVPAQQQETASKQLLESLIDRQLLLSEATKEKLDRDPKVVQSIERAKALIIAQAYMQKHLPAPTKPTAAEVSEYYAKNPVFFANRKVLEMRQLVVATKDLSPELKAVLDANKSLEEVASWMEAHKVEFSRSQAARATSDLPPEMSAKVLSLPKGQLFIVREGARSVIIAVTDIKDAPVTEQVAAPQIEQFLAGQRSKTAAAAEMARLRAAAKIEYFNKTTGEPEAAPAATPAAAPAPAAAAAVPAATDAASAGDATARGVAGLK
ncbi:peptidyl-prolyl cis-trans isomerase, EpsD family [Pseudoduganella sp. FT55W]|uniref:peptidylprolyl isomerase n=1 Tax=Duganella rivi TaxID=2666083 RepID=A0A7X4GLP0_9BURK|nr:EpsD family peptidyl-prolyl cis-trans isomerase [Duganella rivi]MYM65296.1 peptidyl-prolyl cis-trans isomerase, EpsD family [Duganella rivi]